MPDSLDESVANLDIEQIYSVQAHNTPLLSAEEEVDLAKRIEAGLFAAELLLPDEDQKLRRKKLAESHYEADMTQLDLDLALLVRKGEAAKERLLSANQLLVMKWAYHYMRGVQPAHMKFLDLVQEGNLGLIRAVEKFDYTKGYKFSTYAVKWIRQSIARGITGTTVAGGERMIHLPVGADVPLRSMNAAAENFKKAHGRAPTTEELSELTEFEPAKIYYLQKLEKDCSVAWLNQKVGEDNDAELGDFQPDSAQGVEEIVLKRTLIDATDRLLGGLTPCERQVIEASYGFADGRLYTVKEVARAMKLKPLEVWDIKNHAERRLCRTAGKAGLKDLLEG